MGQAEPLKLVFMGTPDLAAVVLRHVLAWERGKVAAVYCRADRPAGRGMNLKAPPVKILALEHGLRVCQPQNFTSSKDVDALRAFAPDYLLVAAYGLILPQAILDVPTRMALNVHTSLLPRHRGAAPIQRAIMEGDVETGATVMVMEASLDTGPIVLQRAVSIGKNDTAQTLHDVLADCGGKLLVEALEGLESGKLTPTPQDSKKATYAAKLTKSDGRVDFSRPCLEIHARIRGTTPWPGAFALLQREGDEPATVGILRGEPLPEHYLIEKFPDASSFAVGALLPKRIENALAVRCVDGAYLIRILRPAGSKAMDAAAFMNGYLKGRGPALFAAPPEAQ